MAQTDERVKVTIRLPGPLVKAAKIRAVETDMDLQDYVAACLEQCLRRKGGR
jgi:predicted DNA binding CopG/RHH family protein